MGGFNIYAHHSFNSSVGILVVRTRLARRWFTIERRVSIPRSEFWSFGPTYRVSAAWLDKEFQFLGRNSGRSDSVGIDLGVKTLAGFNSSVGILVVRTSPGNSFHSRPSNVSIPRSEFWSFGHHGR